METMNERFKGIGLAHSKMHGSSWKWRSSQKSNSTAATYKENVAQASSSRESSKAPSSTGKAVTKKSLYGGPLVQNNRWNTDPKPISLASSNIVGKAMLLPFQHYSNKQLMNKHRISAPGRLEQKSQSRAHTVELVRGLESIDHAKGVLNACLAKDSMLQFTLDRVGFHYHVKDEKSNINTSNSYDIKTRTTAEGKRQYEYSVVLEYYGLEMKRGQKDKLQEVFAKYHSPGFVDWLGGAKGWRFDCKKIDRVSWKRRYVFQLNTLQSIWKLFAPGDQMYFFLDEKKRMIWRKHPELTEIVSDARVWVEYIDNVRPSGLTRQLLRNSSYGPDCLVHWAHHHPVGFISYCIKLFALHT